MYVRKCMCVLERQCFESDRESETNREVYVSERIRRGDVCVSVSVCVRALATHCEYKELPLCVRCCTALGLLCIVYGFFCGMNNRLFIVCAL